MFEYVLLIYWLRLISTISETSAIDGAYCVFNDERHLEIWRSQSFIVQNSFLRRHDDVSKTSPFHTRRLASVTERSPLRSEVRRLHEDRITAILYTGPAQAQQADCNMFYKARTRQIRPIEPQSRGGIF